MRRKAFRKPGVDHTAAERAILVRLLDAAHQAKKAGYPVKAQELRQEAQAAALTFGHGASGEHLKVSIEHVMGTGAPYAAIGSVWRGD